MVGWVVVRRVVCQVIQQVFRRQENSKKAKRGRGPRRPQPVAPEAYQVILKLGIIGQFREVEPPRVHTRINSWGIFCCVHKLTCGKRGSVS